MLDNMLYSTVHGSMRCAIDTVGHSGVMVGMKEGIVHKLGGECCPWLIRDM